MPAEIPEVIKACLVSGDYDYYIRIAVRDTRDYERLLREKLYRIPGIRHSRSSFVLRTLKQSLIPLSAVEAMPAASSDGRRKPRATRATSQPKKGRTTRRGTNEGVARAATCFAAALDPLQENCAGGTVQTGQERTAPRGGPGAYGPDMACR
jgi:hypothetical protein